MVEINDDYMRNKHYSLAVVDADYIPYRAAAAVEKVKYALENESGDVVAEFDSAKECKNYMDDAADFFGEDVSKWRRLSWREIGSLKDAKKVCDQLVKHITRTVSADKYRYYVQGKDNFRDKVATIKKYKDNRSEISKPKYLQDIKDYLIYQHGAKLVNGAESDDYASVSLAVSHRKDGDDTSTCLVCVDKDLMGTPGIHYDPVKDEFTCVNQQDADRWLFTQALTGDRTDNIQGLPDLSKKFRQQYNLTNRKGVGAKTAEVYLDSCGSLQEGYTMVLRAYRDYYGELYNYESWDNTNLVKTYEEIADENIALVFMMRHKNEIWFDYKKRMNLKGLDE